MSGGDDVGPMLPPEPMVALAPMGQMGIIGLALSLVLLLCCNASGPFPGWLQCVTLGLPC